MINVEHALQQQYPGFSKKPSIVRKPTLAFLRSFMREADINHFLLKNQLFKGFDFINKVFDSLNFSYDVSAQDRANIPACGRVIIFANQPIGSLDSLALLKLVGSVRSDVKISSNSLMNNLEALDDYILQAPKGLSKATNDASVVEALEQEQAIIVFPANDVSGVRPTGVKDSHWRASFLKFAKQTNAPLLPIRIHAKNSMLFYGASLISKPFGRAMLIREMFKHRSTTIKFSVGGMISSRGLNAHGVHDRTIVKRLKKHLYRLGGNKPPVFESECTIAHPEPRESLQAELDNARLLGQTRDNNHIYLVDYGSDSSVIREIGRLREVAFRMVGEGTGKSRDLDDYDKHYKHLVLWDKQNRKIAGSYRLGEGKKLLESKGESGFYTSSLYNFKPEFKEYLEQSLELGRSFVNPDYWGKSSLDYLWQGLGTYIAQSTGIRYLIGPVSMSAQYPRALMDELVYFYTRYYAHASQIVTAHFPYDLAPEKSQAFDTKFGALERDEAFDFMQKNFIAAGHKLPILYKQYTSLFEDDGFKILVFSVDPDFNDCLDGLCICDLYKIKEKKRKRYIGT